MISDELKAKIRTDNGRPLMCIVHEFNPNKTKPAVYTMRDHDWGGYLSLKKIYMESVDEYEAAMEITGSWEHWQRLCKNKTFMNGEKARNLTGLSHWREEKKLSEASKAKRLLENAAKTGNVQAAKTLYDDVKAKEDNRGRPVKVDPHVEAEAKKKDDTIRDALSRVRVAVDNTRNPQPENTASS